MPRQGAEAPAAVALGDTKRYVLGAWLVELERRPAVSARRDGRRPPRAGGPPDRLACFRRSLHRSEFLLVRRPRARGLKARCRSASASRSPLWSLARPPRLAAARGRVEPSGGPRRAGRPGSSLSGGLSRRAGHGAPPGFAESYEEYYAGNNAAGAPVFDHSGRVVLLLLTWLPAAMPATRMKRYGRLLWAAAKRVRGLSRQACAAPRGPNGRGR